ncbi:MAG TPA: DNA-formamidopyrimidine glycosylase family protein [Acidimicrobiales bacterium]|jgi:formamidopyrimidine-DNA glycosylase|nr:DNA-formamidopyrimidine glycosylase family protein [Acidimicrobiales bacterium]
MPEVQAHAERLTDEFAGAVLDRFRPLAFTALKTFAPAPEAAAGHPLLDVGRRGKHLLLRFEPVTFVVHLMQGGRLKPDEKQAAKPRGGQARWTFADGRALLLTEAGTERKAGVWVVEGDPGGQEPLDHLGPEADTLDRAALGRLLADNPMRLHGWLRDQHILAGLGRRLANEICHRAKLSPFASTGKLDDEAVDRLHAALGECIAESLAYERTRSDMSSSKDRPGAVHHRQGEACPVCGDTVRAVEYRSYTVNYCPTCQTGGKVLADNTTSKFLK